MWFWRLRVVAAICVLSECVTSLMMEEKRGKHSLDKTQEEGYIQ